LTWVQISIYTENDFENIPQRNYEKILYENPIQMNDEYNITFGDEFYNPDGRRYTFIMDDIAFIQGGTIETDSSSKD
jgi:hypothetical protein